LYSSVLPPLRSVSIVDVVSVLVASSVHRERVEGLVAARTHVLGEKSLSDTLVPQRQAVPAGQGVAR
jgi:predicted dehydrogenase